MGQPYLSGRYLSPSCAAAASAASVMRTPWCFSYLGGEGHGGAGRGGGAMVMLAVIASIEQKTLRLCWHGKERGTGKESAAAERLGARLITRWLPCTQVTRRRRRGGGGAVAAAARVRDRRPRSRHIQSYPVLSHPILSSLVAQAPEDGHGLGHIGRLDRHLQGGGGAPTRGRQGEARAGRCNGACRGQRLA